MKKFIKVMLIIAAVFAVVGLGLSAAGAVMGADMENVEFTQTVKERFGKIFTHMDFDDWDIDWHDDWDDDHDDGKDVTGTDEDNKKIYHAEAVKNLEIDLKYDEVILEAHSDSTIRVEVADDDAGNVNVKTDSQTLKITSSSKVSPHRTIYVYYPEDMMFHELDIELDAGNIEIHSDIAADNLEVFVGAGQFVNSASVTAKETSLEVGTGNIELYHLDTMKLDGECGMGAMVLELAGKESDYSYSLECGMGNIDLDSQSYGGLGKEKSIRNPGALREMELECGMGEISVSFLGN